MIKPTKWVLAATTAAALAGCGGSNSPLLGTGQSPRVRGLDLIAGSPSLTVDYTNTSNLIGTVTADTATPYATEGEGNNTVTFNSGGNAIASLNSVFQYSDYYTVVVYSKSGQDGTFSVVDNNVALDNGTSQIRAADAITTATTNVDVYVTPGTSANPTLIAGNLISNVNGGLAFATATAYKSENPGSYTITVTPTGVPGTVLLNQTETLNSGQTITVDALDNSDEGG
jgi:hypothetical protein